MIKAIALYAAFLLSATLYGQDKRLPLSLSVFNEATALPFTRFFSTPLHPGMQIGTAFTYKEKTQIRIFQTANLNYFYHNQLNQGIGLYSEIGYEYRIKSGLAFTGLFGLGYMHTFATEKEFTFVDGRYEQRVDKGNARLYPSLSLDIGYYLNPESKTSSKLFLRYQAWAEFPYSPGFIPVMTHINLHLGVTVFIKRAIRKK